MAFIDIFNFKKYFRKPSDAQVARYGHVNALYDNLTNSFAIQTGAYTKTGTTVPVTTKSGIISIATTLNAGEYIQFRIINETITENTVVLLNAYNRDSGTSLLHAAPWAGPSPDGGRYAVITNIGLDTVENIELVYYIVA